jgi:hypothetical protein
LAPWIVFSHSDCQLGFGSAAQMFVPHAQTHNMNKDATRFFIPKNYRTVMTDIDAEYLPFEQAP